jgi:hypothetical protein
VNSAKKVAVTNKYPEAEGEVTVVVESTAWATIGALLAAMCLTLAASVPASAGEGSRPTSLSAQRTIEPSAGQWMDVAPFGEIRTWEAGKDVGVLWEDPRDIFKVVVKFAQQPVDAASIKLQYWVTGGWPRNRVPRDKESLARLSGWTPTGDWFNGHWQDADVQLTTNGTEWTYTFNPANAKEFKESDFDGKYRTTMKIRLLFEGQPAPVAELHAFTDSVWDRVSAVVQWLDPPTTVKTEAFNGYVSSSTTSAGQTQLDVWYVKPQAAFSRDETIVTLRTNKHSFSFNAREVAEGNRILIPDFGVLVTRADDKVTYEQARAELAKGQKSRFDLVSELPEQTLPKAWSDMPLKGRIYMPLAVEGSREHFAVLPNGDIRIGLQWAKRIKGKDTPRIKWDSDEPVIRVGLPVTNRTGASIEEGILPIAITWYESDGVRYLEEAFATPLSAKLPRSGRVPGDEPIALMLKFRLTNLSDVSKIASLPMRVEDGGEQQLSIREGLVYGKGKQGEFVRFYISSNGVADINVQGTVVTCSVSIPPRQTREFFVTIPFITPETPEEIAALKSLDYYEQHKLIAGYWKKRLAQSARIITPEPMINQFLAAYPSHALINTDNEPGNDERAMAKVGTFHYGVYTNESVMMITELDRRGYHDVARKAYETWIHYQGTAALPGDYSTKEGVFYGAGGCQAGGYNQHHGWCLWGLAEHYWFTRDDQWLRRVAPAIVKGCDWIINERKRTFGEEYTGIREIERGLLPAGSLEDIGDWKSWMSNNVMSYWGMHNAAKALAAIGHPDSQRLLREAAAYREDIRKAFFEAMVRSPVARLRDGTYVPIIPSEVHRRGRSVGWICEVLEGSIHMIRCGIVDPSEPAYYWIMKDYEDNRYLAEQYGYLVPYPERDWFSLGGFCQQPSLLCSPTPYIMDDHPKHYVRAYFNAFAAGYFPERAMITEHPLPNLGNYAGDHFKSSDEGMNSSWVRWMFIWDEGEDLFLAKTMPRYWLADGKEVRIERAVTHFGVMSMSIKSKAASGFIEMTIDPPTRNAPRAIYARFRHPEGKSMNRVTVNGKPYDNFDPEKEWVVLPPLKEKTVVVAYYD